MSTFRNPVGPQPSSVYWRRRLVVGLAALAVLVIILLIIFSPKGKPPAPGASDAPKPGATETMPPKSSSEPCAPGVVDLTADTDKNSYAAGEKPQLSLTLTNKGAIACTINAGATQQEFLITSGSELYWNSTDCQSNATDAFIVLEPNVKTEGDPITWDRTRSSTTTCAGERPAAPGGGASYHLNINLGDLKSNDVQFILN